MTEAVEGLTEDLILRRTQDGTHCMSTNPIFFVCGMCHAVYARLVNQIIIRFILNQIIIRFFPLPWIQSMRPLEMNFCACLHTHTHTHSDMSRYQSAEEERMSLRMRSSMLTYADVCWRMLA